MVLWLPQLYLWREELKVSFFKSIMILTLIALPFFGREAGADGVTSLKYYYPACPFWLYPLARDWPIDCKVVTYPACAPEQVCSQKGTLCLHEECILDGKSVEQHYTTCLDKRPEPGRHGCPI